MRTMWRLVKLESPCSRNPTQRAEPAPVVAGDEATPPPATTGAGAVPARALHRFLVLGSFGNYANPARFRSEFGDDKDALVETTIEGRIIYRVVAGPLSDEEAMGLRAKLAAENRGPAWAVATLPEP